MGAQVVIGGAEQGGRGGQGQGLPEAVERGCQQLPGAFARDAQAPAGVAQPAFVQGESGGGVFIPDRVKEAASAWRKMLTSAWL